MKAIKLDKPGVENPLISMETNIPQPGKGEVLIRTRAFSINPVDIKTRRGMSLYESLKNENPLILGWDVAGVVVKTGDGVDKYKAGDEVFGMVVFPGHGKAYAEFVVAPVEHLAMKPANISFEQAAASSLAALTAYQILARHIKSGDRVFIQSAAGGVGHFAVQIAKIMGAHTIGTASAKNEEFLNSIGLDQFINYKKADFEKEASDVDFALDTMGKDILIRTFKMMKKGGTIISIVARVNDELKSLSKEKDVFMDFELVVSNGKDMAQIAAWLKQEKIVPHVSKIYAMDEIEEAHQQIISGTTRGKIVVSL